MRHRVKNFGIEVNTFFININYEEIERKSKNLISNIFKDFKTKNISKNVIELFDFFNKQF